MKKRKVNIDTEIYEIDSDDGYLNNIGIDFEPYMVNLFKALIKPTDRVADIGSNIGLTAILFSSLAQEVYAFEPSPSTFYFLNKNIRQNRCTNVKTVNLGMGERPGTLPITYSVNDRAGAFVSDKIQLNKG